MKPKFITLRTLLLSAIVVPSALFAQTGNVGVGTTSPTTKLDVNGGLTTREAAPALTVGAGPVNINNLNYSQFRLTGATAPFTINGPTVNGPTALVAGARLVIVNASGQTGTLNGFDIPTGTAQEFAYSGGAWVATSGGATGRDYYDWLKAGNNFPTTVGDNGVNIYHTGGNVGIGTTNPTEKLHVNTAVSNEGIALSQTQYTNTIMLNSNANGGFLGFINNSASTDAGLTAFIQKREPGAADGFANDLVYSTGNGDHVFLQTVGIFESQPAAGYALDVGGGIQCNFLAATQFIEMDAFAGGGNREIGVNNTGRIIVYPSDGRLKKDVTDMTQSLDKVMQLHPVYYNWNDTVLYGQQREIGFISQEVKNVIPEVSGTFKKDGEEYHTIAYTKLVPVLTKAIQEQQSIIEAQNKRIAELESLAADTDARLKKLETLMDIKPKPRK